MAVRWRFRPIPTRYSTTRRIQLQFTAMILGTACFKTLSKSDHRLSLTPSENARVSFGKANLTLVALQKTVILGSKCQFAAVSTNDRKLRITGKIPALE